MRNDRRLISPRVTGRSNQPFLWLLSLLLLIYAMLGRSGAYIGLPTGGGTGIFIGELVLFFGVAGLVLRGGYERLFSLPLAWVWLAFCVWNAAQTVPYVSEYGLMAVRDAVIWGYSLYAAIIASLLMVRPSGFVILLN